MGSLFGFFATFVKLITKNGKKSIVGGIVAIIVSSIISGALNVYDDTQSNKAIADKNIKDIAENHTIIEHRIDHTDNLWTNQQTENEDLNRRVGLLEGQVNTIAVENDRLLEQGLRENEINNKK